MRALLVRHARAGSRRRWTGDDRLRPLDRKGRRQARELARTLASLGVTRLLSSPYVRCVQTLEPAGERLGLPVEARPELAEGAARDDVAVLLGELEDGVPALSTHGDVIVELLGPAGESRKGGIWVLELTGGQVRAERYLEPPA